MNYSEPLISQVTVFFRAIGCGVLLGVLYDAVGIIRMLFGEKKCIYVFFDTAFFLAASAVSFFFMVLYNSGQVRFNLIFAELVSAVVFHFSFGVYILKQWKNYVLSMRKVIRFLTKPFCKGIKKLRKNSEKLLQSISKKRSEREKNKKISKKFGNIGKILLKNKNKSV